MLAPVTAVLQHCHMDVTGVQQRRTAVQTGQGAAASAQLLS